MTGGISNSSSEIEAKKSRWSKMPTHFEMKERGREEGSELITGDFWFSVMMEPRLFEEELLRGAGWEWWTKSEIATKGSCMESL